MECLSAGNVNQAISHIQRCTSDKDKQKLKDYINRHPNGPIAKAIEEFLQK